MKKNAKTGIIVIAGLLAICALSVGIYKQYQPEKAEDNWQPADSTPTSSIIVSIDEPEEASISPSPSVPEVPDTSAEETLVEPEESTSSETETEQKIQPDPVKPEPSDEALQDESTPPTEETEEPTVSPPASTEPESNNQHEGEMYVPGFGWIEDHGGGGVGEYVPDMYESGVKIGDM